MVSQQLLSKIATNDKHGENSPYFDGWKAYDRNPFHPTKNPQGVIQMGLAENQVCVRASKYCFSQRWNIMQFFDVIIISWLIWVFVFYAFLFQLCFDLIEEWIRNNPRASICTPEGVHQFRNIANFQDYHGLREFTNVSNRQTSFKEEKYY